MAPTQQERLKELDLSTRQDICLELNVPRCLGGDYKTLAALLNMSSTRIQVLEKKDDPANEVLKWWETVGHATVDELQRLFVKMRRDDLVLILENRPKGMHLRYINATVWHTVQCCVLSSAEKYIHHCAGLNPCAKEKYIRYIYTNRNIKGWCTADMDSKV